MITTKTEAEDTGAGLVVESENGVSRRGSQE